MKTRTLLSWSSGKDSAWALHKLRQNPEIDLAGLFTVINRKYRRASMHATRIELVCKQAAAAGLESRIIELPDQCSNEECDAIMTDFIQASRADGIESMAFGDLFLQDIRRYRENQLRGTGITPLFPLWKIPTMALARQMLAAGVEAYISSVDLARLPGDFAGRKWSEELIHEMPAECDPCGENGEMHTIVVGGPMFRSPIPVHVGQIVERNGFMYADIVPD